MQVILLQDVANVGKKYQEIEVANGYGTNYLIPNGLAQVATDETRNRYEKLQEKAEKERRKEREALANAVESIDGSSLTIEVDRVGDQGQLFSGIYPKDIAGAVNEEFDVDITGADIDRDQPFNKVGKEEVTVKILDTEVTLTVSVEATEEAKAAVKESKDGENDEEELAEEGDDSSEVDDTNEADSEE